MSDTHFAAALFGPPVTPDEVADLPVAALMQRWPQTAALFTRRRMACPGCVMAPFMSVAEAAEAYGLEPEALIGDLLAVVNAKSA
jgi:hybrid cluster-associated redox disulfide protein